MSLHRPSGMLWRVIRARRPMAAGTAPLFASLGAVLCALFAACGGGGSVPERATAGAPKGTFRPADLVFGQPGFTGQQSNRGTAKPEGDSLSGPGILAPDESGVGLLYVPDIGNHRVLGFFQTPIINNLAANFVLGQPGFEYDEANVGPTALSSPVCAVNDGERLCVSDFGNDRVVVWNQVPLTNGAPADLVLGQSGMNHKGSATTATGMDGPLGLAVVAGRILVADSGNNRILIWNSVPQTSGTPADLVLGQADFVSGLANRGGPPSAATLSEPFAVWSDGDRIAVADRANNRVLVWATWPEGNGTPADFVIGQSGATDVGVRAGADGLHGPTDISSDGGRLLVADGGNNRILIWDEFPAADATPANAVLGQGRFDTAAANDDDQDGFPDAAPTARTLSGGTAGILTVRVVGVSIFVGDTGNNRVLIFHE